VRIEVKVTPKASRNAVIWADGGYKVYVTAAPEKGQANEAVREVLASALGVAKSRLSLILGETSRQKAFLVDGELPEDWEFRLGQPKGT